MKHCEVCAFNAQHGYIPSRVVWHCHACCTTGGGLAEVHCGGLSGCHRTFGGMTAFDAHKRGEVCRDPSALKDVSGAPRFQVVMRKHGAVWVKKEPESRSSRRSEPRRTA